MATEKSEYFKKYLDPRWQKKRLEIMERDDFTCQFCGDKESTLNVHHKYYIWGNEPWDYKNEALVTICEECHEKEGWAKDQMNYAIKEILHLGYTYEHISQLLSGLFDYSDYDKTQKVRLASFACHFPDILDAIEVIRKEGESKFFTELFEKLRKR